MLGDEVKSNLPQFVIDKVKDTANQIRTYHHLLGTVSIEWVYDGNKLWIVQMNPIKRYSNNKVIVDGNPNSYLNFNTADGLERLREVVNDIKGQNIGIRLIGDIGICSHFGDILRHSDVPSFIHNGK